MEDLIQLITKNKDHLIPVYAANWTDEHRGALFVQLNPEKQQVDSYFLQYHQIAIPTIKQQLDRMYMTYIEKPKIYFVAVLNDKESTVLDITVPNETIQYVKNAPKQWEIDEQKKKEMNDLNETEDLNETPDKNNDD